MLGGSFPVNVTSLHVAVLRTDVAPFVAFWLGGRGYTAHTARDMKVSVLPCRDLRDPLTLAIFQVYSAIFVVRFSMTCEAQSVSCDKYFGNTSRTSIDYLAHESVLAVIIQLRFVGPDYTNMFLAAVMGLVNFEADVETCIGVVCEVVRGPSSTFEIRSIWR